MRQAVGERRTVVEDELVGAVHAGVALLAPRHGRCRPRPRTPAPAPRCPGRRAARRSPGSRRVPSPLGYIASPRRRRRLLDLLPHEDDVTRTSGRHRGTTSLAHPAYRAAERAARRAVDDGPLPRPVLLSRPPATWPRAVPFFRRLTGDGRVDACAGSLAKRFGPSGRFWETCPMQNETGASRVPDQPSVDGLEAKWSAIWEEQGTYRFDRTKTREQIYSIDTPPPTVSGSLHVGHVFSLHAHRLHRALPADARARGLLPDGLGRQRPADRAPGAELLRRALRPVAPLRPRLHAAGRSRTQAAGADLAAQLHRALPAS